MIIIPEVIIYDFLKSGFKLIKDDYERNADKSWLKDLFVDKDTRIRLESMDYYEQAVKMFTKNAGDTRVLEMNLGYNLQRAQTPTIHILMPSESPVSAGIGRNEGYQEAEVDGIAQESYGVANTNYSTTYNLLITSNNSGEVTIIYHTLKSMFLALQPILENKRLMNCRFGGSDISFQDDLVPSDIFHRNFNVSFEYENNVRDFSSMKIADDFIIGEADFEKGDLTIQL